MNTTIGEALQGAGPKLRQLSDTPSTDAQLLLAEALGRPRAWILAHSEHEIGGAQLDRFEALLTEVVNGAALPHVLGWWEFYGRRFYLDPQVLIPRPETELMVETAVSRSAQATRILDIGTGCGCIAITLALELPKSRIYASDISWGALQVARHNIGAHGVERSVTLINANLVDAFIGPFDVVCANLPYVATDQLPLLSVARREPVIALDGGISGTELIYSALERMPEILADGGCALFEIDPDQKREVVEQGRMSFPGERLRVETDLAGSERLLVVERE